MSAERSGDSRIVVRKVALGSAPYAWEIHDGATSLPRYICRDRFKSMQSAYEAGQAWLTRPISATQRPQVGGLPIIKVREVESDWSRCLDNETDDESLLDNEVDRPE